MEKTIKDESKIKTFPDDQRVIEHVSSRHTLKGRMEVCKNKTAIVYQ